MGYVIALVLVAGSILAMWVSGLATRAKDYATLQRGGGGLARRRMRPGEAVFAYTVVFLILALVLAPHLGLLLLSFATVWSAHCPTRSPWPTTRACSATARSPSRTR